MNKTFFLKSILFVGLAVCMFSCNDEDSPFDGGNTPQGVNVIFDYSQAKLSRTVGSSAMLNGSSDVDWTIEVEEGDFFSVEPMSGTAGDFKLTVTANKNNTSTEKAYSKFIFNASGRKYPVTVIHLEDDIRLKPSYEAETIFSFNQNGTLLSPDLNAKSLTATSNIEWTVKTVNKDDTWIEVGPEVGEKGENLPISVAVKENPFAKERTGKFEVRIPEGDSYQYVVTQMAATLVYSIKDGETELNDQIGLTAISGAGETHTITLNANADWKIAAIEDNSWLKFEPSEGEASLEPVEVKVIVEPNEDMEGLRCGSFVISFGEKVVISIGVQQNKGEMPEEVTALKALENTLEGENNDVLNWSSEADYNLWEGVKFEAGKLIELNLSNKGLKGCIPEGISQFTSLRVIDLSNNELVANAALEKITVNTTSSGNSIEGIDDSYIPAIPVGIKNLLNLTVFKLSGNKIEGIFPSDVVNNPNYLGWKAMENIYPQGEVKYSAIQYNPKSNTRYNVNASNADPSKWKFKLNQVGILRAMYYAMGGEHWKDADVEGEPVWLNHEYLINQKGYKSETNPKMTAIGQIGGNKDVQSFQVSQVSGRIPEECLMNAGLAHFRVSNQPVTEYKLAGGIHPLIIQRLNYMQFKDHDLTLDANFILCNVRNSVKDVMFENNINISGNTDFDLLNTYCVEGKIATALFSFKGTSISGTVTASSVKVFSVKNTAKQTMTIDEWKTKVPIDFIVK